MNKRVGIYARVSTKDQTTENQLLDLRKYCETRGWTIAAECVDHGISGAKDDRPQLKTVMTLARQRKIDVLLVWRFDRFARSLTHLVNSLSELRTLAVDFVSYQEGIDTSSAQGRMVFGVIASLAEFERELIRERVRASIRRLRACGVKLGRPGVEQDKIETVLSWVSQRQAVRLSVREIAAKAGISKSAVQRILSQKPQAKEKPKHAEMSVV